MIKRLPPSDSTSRLLILQMCLGALFLSGCFHAQAQPRFQVTQDQAGKYWFSDQESGNQFLSIGINHVVEVHDHEPPEGSIYYDAVNTVFDGDHDAWQDSTAKLLSENGFNTYGAWSSPRANDGALYETPVLYVAGHDHERVLFGLLPDFEDTVRENLRMAYDPIEEKGQVIGVFLDNEMAWYGRSPWDKSPRYTMLEHALTLPPENKARAVVTHFLKQKYDTPQNFSSAWQLDVTDWDSLDGNVLRGSSSDAAMADRAELIELAADSFYRRAGNVVREEIPGVLILGTRFAGDAPDAVIKACGKYSDVVSYNHYRARPEIDARLLTRYWLLTKKPLMITEYSWRATINHSGNPNTGGAGSVVKTQAQRGVNYTGFVEDAFKYPMVIGMHWFEFSDQSPHGRFDGENSNYGIVNIFHQPYHDLLEKMKIANSGLHDIHKNSTRPIPDQMPEPPKAIVEISQYPNRPASIDLLAEPSIRGVEIFNADDATIEVSEGSTGLTFTIQTGTTWGGGANFFGPEQWAIMNAPEGATNLDGYSTIRIELESSDSVPIEIIIDEAGVDSPNAESYDLRAGDDGESFAFESITLKPGSNSIQLDLNQLTPRGVWGNQLGNRRVDTQALKGIGIIFLPGPSPSTVTVKSLNLEK